MIDKKLKNKIIALLADRKTFPCAYLSAAYYEKSTYD